MNPTVPQEFVDAEFERDPASAAAEYEAEFRTDIESYLSREIVESCIIPGRYELPPTKSISYIAFCDPSGGSSDSMTLAVGHRENDSAIIDAIREFMPPFSPEQVVEEFSALLLAYGIRKVEGDKYGGEWPRERFRLQGVTYEPAARPKSDLYRDLLPLLNAGKIELLDHPKSVSQIAGLERRTARGGRDSIDHGPGQHDDVANAIAGVATRAVSFIKKGPIARVGTMRVGVYDGIVEPDWFVPGDRFPPGDPRWAGMETQR